MIDKKAYLFAKWRESPGLRGIFARAWRSWQTAISRNSWKSR
ncbi:MAG TPA: hypothetical protein P5536_07555 [Methanoregulaceae archaeon]|nr:hypothetical protein [Methanoregulaceae archaeon]